MRLLSSFTAAAFALSGPLAGPADAQAQPSPASALTFGPAGDPGSFPDGEVRIRGVGMSIQTGLYGWENFATALSIVANDPAEHGHAGVDGGFAEPRNRSNYAQADQVGLYTQINAPPRMVYPATVDAHQIHFAPPLTQAQVADIKPHMQVHTNQWPYWIAAVTAVAADGRSATIDQWVRANDAANTSLGHDPAEYPYTDRRGEAVSPAVRINPVNNLYGQNTLMFAAASDDNDPSRAVGYELGCINPTGFVRVDGMPEESGNGCWGFESQATIGKGSNAFITQGIWDVGYLALAGDVAGFLAAPSVFYQQGHGTSPAAAFQSNLPLHYPVLVASPVVSNTGRFPYGKTIELFGDGLLKLGAQAKGSTATPAPGLELFSAGGAVPSAAIVATQGTQGLPNGGNLNLIAGAIALRGAVVVSQHTPNSSAEHCIAGQVASDDSYFYACSSMSRWRRAALSDW